VTFGDQEYWMDLDGATTQDPSPTAYLLPAYDEYYVGYRDREAVLNPGYDAKQVSSHGYFRPMIVIDGQIVGTWTSSIHGDWMTIELATFEVLTDAQEEALDLAAARYAAFLGLRSAIAPSVSQLE
jgi:hypothetical protein